jgi:ankyrin repeat protein
VEEHVDGVDCLMIAAESGHEEAVKYFLEKGADPRKTDDDDKTALTNAVKGNFGEVSARASERARMKEKAASRSRSLDARANERGSCVSLPARSTLARMKEEAAARTCFALDTRALLLPCSSFALELTIPPSQVAAILVAAGADPDTEFVDEEGVSHNLLMDSIIVENDEFARLLIENGADVTHKDEAGVTTLLQAAHRGLGDIVELLLKKGGVDVRAPRAKQLSSERRVR